MANLPIEIPSELLATGGTITIQKRKVSVTKGGDGHTDHATSAPLTSSNNSHSSSSTTTTTSSTHNNDQGVPVPIARNNDNKHTESSSSATTTKTTTSSSDQGTSVPITRNTDTSSSNTLNQQQSNTSERRGSKVIVQNLSIYPVSFVIL